MYAFDVEKTASGQPLYPEPKPGKLVTKTIHVLRNEKPIFSNLKCTLLELIHQSTPSS